MREPQFFGTMVHFVATHTGIAENHSLYQLSCFYVEVTFTDHSGIADITAFITGHKLDKYLDRINL